METPRAFWERCSAALPAADRARGFSERRIGSTPEMVDQIIELVVSGAKTGTCSLAADLESAGPLPAPGDYVILTRHDGAAACLLELVGCEQKLLGEVSAADRALEAPVARDAAVWRQIHQAYWQPRLDARGEVFSDRLPVFLQTFRVVAIAP